MILRYEEGGWRVLLVRDVEKLQDFISLWFFFKFLMDRGDIMRMPDALLIAGLLFVLMLLSGCQSLTVIDIKDSSAFSPTLRVSHNLQSPEENTKSLAIDMEVSRTSGKSSQYLPNGDYIDFGSGGISGPAQVDTSCNVSNAMLGIRSGWIRRAIDIEWTAGLDILDSKVKLKSGAQSLSDRLSSAGPFFGWKFSLKPNEAVTLYGKSTFSVDISGPGYVLSSGELGASIYLARNVALFAGWRWMSLNYAQDNTSDINIDISGPTAGMELAF